MYPDGGGYAVVQRVPDASRADGREYAHRLAYRLGVGPIPDGKLVMHLCDNPRCCNYERHLTLGTIADNIGDAAAKGRLARGERAGNAILTDAIVTAARGLSAGGMSKREIVAHLGLPRGVYAALSAAIRGSCWAHVLAPPVPAWEGPPRKGLAGELASGAVLTDAIVTAARRLAAGGPLTVAAIAAELGVAHVGALGRAIRGERWRHLTTPPVRRHPRHVRLPPGWDDP